MTDAALAVLGDKSVSTDDKRRRLEQIVYAELDFDTMSRLVLARNWSRFLSMSFLWAANGRPGAAPSPKPR